VLAAGTYDFSTSRTGSCARFSFSFSHLLFWQVGYTFVRL
jgi:hypothetical protein